MGPSLGGMTVLAYVALFPGAARRLVSISGSMAASPFAIALRSIQREAILLDPQWKNGNYAVDALPVTGMRIGRMLGMMTYRSAAEWRERFSRQLIPEDQRRKEPFAPEFQIQGYLEAHAQKFVKAFDPCCYIYISRAMDRFDLAAHGGSHVAPLKKAGLQGALVIGVESDMLFSIGEQAALAKTLKDAGVPTQFAPLTCIEGHDSFLIDFDTFGREIGGFLG
jgi:homoserine O-acetyltransferase